MIEAKLQGRRLILTVIGEETDEPIEPFVISPLPAAIGRQLTADYLNTILGIGNVSSQRKRDIFTIAVDGCDPATGEIRRDEISGEPLTPNTDRIAAQITQEEGEILTLAAFMWHTIVGMDGVTQFLAAATAEGSTAAAGKAIRLLSQRLAILPSTRSHSTESANLTRTVDTPVTATLRGGAKPASALDRLPPGRRSIRKRRP